MRTRAVALGGLSAPLADRQQRCWYQRRLAALCGYRGSSPLRYDLMKDFEPVGLIATQPFLIAARKAMPANNLKELIAWLRANGDKTNVGHSGVGTPSHVAGLLFEKAIGTNFTMVRIAELGRRPGPDRRTD